MSTTCGKIVEQIERVKKQLQELGPMRPGAISRQYRNPKEKKRPFYQISYSGLSHFFSLFFMSIRPSVCPDRFFFRAQ